MSNRANPTLNRRPTKAEREKVQYEKALRHLQGNQTPEERALDDADQREYEEQEAKKSLEQKKKEREDHRRESATFRLTIGQFYKLDRSGVLREAFHVMGKSWQQIEVMMILLRMYLAYQDVHPSANWLAGQTGCSEKTVDRLVGWLKSEKLVSVERLRRYDGYYSVNRFDLTRFIQELERLLKPLLKYPAKGIRFYKARNSLTVKAWFATDIDFWEASLNFDRLPTGETRLWGRSNKTVTKLAAQGYGLCQNNII